MLIANSGIYLLQGAQYLAVITILVSGGSLGIGWCFLARLFDSHLPAEAELVCHEPFLSSVTGVLISLTLIATIHFAYAVAVRRKTALGQHDPQCIMEA